MSSVLEDDFDYGMDGIVFAAPCDAVFMALP
jgi:hypothetical protein